MNSDEVISRDPEVLSGTAVFAGTRVPVSSLFAHLKAGDPVQQFLHGFPTVTREQAEAVLELALDSLLEECEHTHSA